MLWALPPKYEQCRYVHSRASLKSKNPKLPTVEPGALSEERTEEARKPKMLSLYPGLTTTHLHGVSENRYVGFSRFAFPN
jgi:hypothetical protein